MPDSLDVNGGPAWARFGSVVDASTAPQRYQEDAFQRSLRERVGRASSGRATAAQAFGGLLSTIEPNQAEQTAASEQQVRVREGLDARLDVANSYLSGSYRRRTLRRPVTDIDMLVVLDAESHGLARDAASASKALDLIFNALSDAYPKTEKMRDSRCIMLQFAGTGIGFDVAPVLQFEEHTFWMPDEQRGVWIRTNPREVQRLVTEANQNVCDGWLVPLVKLLKTWKRHHDVPLRGFHLEALAYHALKHAPANEREGLQYLFEQLSTTIYLTTPDIWLGGENASSSLTMSDQMHAAAALAAAAAVAKAANDAERAGRIDDAHAKWYSLLGDEYPETGATREEARRAPVADALNLVRRNAPFTATSSGISPLVAGLVGVPSSTSHGGAVEVVVPASSVPGIDDTQSAQLEREIDWALEQFPALTRIAVADAIANPRLWPMTARDAESVYAVLLGLQRTNYGTSREILVKVFKESPAREPRVYMLQQRVARRPVSRKGIVTFVPVRTIRHQWGDRAMCTHALRDKWDGRLVTVLVFAANWLLRQEHHRRTGRWIGHEIGGDGTLVVNGERAARRDMPSARRRMHVPRTRRR